MTPSEGYLNVTQEAPSELITIAKINFYKQVAPTELS